MSRAPARGHQPVLLDEVIEALRVRPDGHYVDATFGRGGHSQAILDRLGEQGRLLALDRDPEAVAVGRKLMSGDRRFEIERSVFSDLARHVEARGWLGQVDGVLMDLGVSSPQLDAAGRGFSFTSDGPLDMRMDPDSGPSAADWLAQASERDIAAVLKEYGEERFARRIAHAIVDARRHGRIESTAQLASLVSEAQPVVDRHKHPATRTFQAIRIFINRELDELDQVLGQSVELLAPGGRLAVISFHSLEDRKVKRFLRDQSRGKPLPRGLPVTQDQLQPLMHLVGKAVQASDAEKEVNPRARSAVLRVAEKLASGGGSPGA